MTEKELDDVYEDRNLLACALATATDAPSGWKPDPESPDEWAIVWIETPRGQVSWHVPIDFAWDLAPPKQDSEYDGYDREKKNRRLMNWTMSGCPAEQYDHSGREPEDTEDAKDVLREALGDDFEDWE